MKNSTAPLTTENFPLKKIEYDDVLTVVTEKAAVPLHRYFPLEKWRNRFLKRCFDLLCSSLLIVLLFSWIFPIIALVILVSSRGPVFFLQQRQKRGGRFFTCIKFRTMVVNKQADELPASENDGRITAVGHFLRKHHLDELPQLFNVWWGDMSMIGPRPHMQSDNLKYEELLAHYVHRNDVKPGITGLAQVLGYVGFIETLDHMQSRVQQDIHYIHNWSLTLDLRIASRTVSKMLKGWGMRDE